MKLELNKPNHNSCAYAQLGKYIRITNTMFFLESNRRQEEKKVNLQKLAAVLEKDKYR
jgi:putative IMPACT (imprinted ancient) family translation regulator